MGMIAKSLSASSLRLANPWKWNTLLANESSINCIKLLPCSHDIQYVLDLLFSTEPYFHSTEIQLEQRAPPELEKSSISEKQSPQCPLFLVALTSIPLSIYPQMTSRRMSLRLWPIAVPVTTVQTLYTVSTLSADWTGKCLLFSTQDIKNRSEFLPSTRLCWCCTEKPERSFPRIYTTKHLKIWKWKSIDLS